MLSFATEVSQLVHSLGEMDTLAVKVASAEDSSAAQQAVAQGSDHLYDVISKTAQEENPKDLPGHYKVALLVNRMSEVLGKGKLSSDTNLKLASVAAADEALSALLEAEPNNTKYAEMRSFGREYMMEILRGVL